MGKINKVINLRDQYFFSLASLHVLREGGVGGQCIIIICATTRREVCENVGLHHLMGILEKVQGLILLLPFLAIFYPRGPNFEIRENHPLQTPNPLF